VKFSLLPVSEEAVLKRAVAVTVFYNLNNVNKDLKALTIDEPDELKDLLAELRIRREDYIGGFGMRGTRRHPVKFHFPNGQVRDHFLEGPNQLGEFVVDRGFYEKLCEIVSRHEGCTVDVLEFHPIPVPPPKIRFNISPPRKE
jgi:hypothetical protein